MCVPRTCYCDDTQLGTRVPWLHCVSGACYEGEETRREGCIAQLFTQYQIEIMLNVWYFYLNVLLFVWVGNETFGPSLGGLGCPVCGSYAQFFVLLCNFEEKPAVLCTYNYKVI